MMREESREAVMCGSGGVDVRGESEVAEEVEDDGGKT